MESPKKTTRFSPGAGAATFAFSAAYLRSAATSLSDPRPGFCANAVDAASAQISCVSRMTSPLSIQIKSRCDYSCEDFTLVILLFLETEENSHVCNCRYSRNPSIASHSGSGQEEKG